ncbi:hypothetical protein SEA_MOLIVIA_97 [Arthrobacter phage Molivia]|uniref:Uncharacterized protein n=1 Tax=Arthrobacter phage Molivia TaxID=2015839 RepID=A0A286S2E9_9CAUD|nr:hypothetical protein FDI28_gp03 [Arthrobacter phage Molivia]YP_009610219.1 hypothetical protein FDI28_gp19 [Arthrobacter phage Molivia]ASX99319.1 hypothetical protein SEA_MOLIVIA_3 [Arthrobacter phage Molivia]ASX99322.1 hypothetical protein SEA_MOLIVIA_97 [Arthrobacter phage Molivia]
MLTKAQKRCAKRGHGYAADIETGEIVSGCVYCHAYTGRPLGIAALSRTMHPLDVATRLTVLVCLLSLSAVSVVCAMWLGAAL